MTENAVIDSTTIAKLQFNSCVFDPIVQAIPIVRIFYSQKNFVGDHLNGVNFDRKTLQKTRAITRLI